MSFDSAQIYELARQFKSAKTLLASSHVLDEHEAFLDAAPEDPQLYWTTLRASGFIKELMKRLSESHDELVRIDRRTERVVLSLILVNALDSL